MFDVYAGDCLPVSLQLLQDENTPEPIADYSISVEFRWVDKSGCDRCYALCGSALTIDLDTAEVSGEVPGCETKCWPIGKIVRANIVLAQSGTCQQTTFLGKVTVRR